MTAEKSQRRQWCDRLRPQLERDFEERYEAVAQLKAGDVYTWDVSFHDIFNSAYKDTVIYFNKWFIERLAIEVAQDMWWDWAHPNLPLGMNSKKDRDYPRFRIKMPRRRQ